MPAALTLILICPSPGSGSGTWAHFSSSGGPYPVITTALGMAVPSWQRPGGPAILPCAKYVTGHVIVNVTCHAITLPEGGRAAPSVPGRAPVDGGRERALLDD